MRLQIKRIAVASSARAAAGYKTLLYTCSTLYTVEVYESIIALFCLEPKSAL